MHAVNGPHVGSIDPRAPSKWHIHWQGQPGAGLCQCWRTACVFSWSVAVDFEYVQWSASAAYGKAGQLTVPRRPQTSLTLLMVAAIGLGW